MPASKTFRLLYLGRQNGFVQELESIWGKHPAPDKEALAMDTLQIHWVSSQAQALAALRVHSYRAILLDVESTRHDRARFCQDLRRRYPELRVCAVCRQGLQPKRFVFDGTLLVPLQQEEIGTLLRSLCCERSDLNLQIGPILLNMETHTVLGARGRHYLPAKQYNLLRLLMQNPGEVVSRELIMREVWETEYVPDTRTLDVHMRWLREKIEPDPARPVHLITVRGQGFRLEAG